MTPAVRSDLGKWMSLAKNRARIMLRDGREGVILCARPNAMTCKILYLTRHYNVWADEITAYWSQSDACWKQLLSWPEPSSREPSRCRERAASASKSWLVVGPPPVPQASRPLPPPPPRVLA